MLSGVVEGMVRIRRLTRGESNLRITLAYSFVAELQIDQGIAHNGVCLTIVSLEKDGYMVTAVQGTLDHNNLGLLQVGNYVNTEYSMMLGGRLDGHIAQGYVDQTARCTAIREMDGSHYFTFAYKADREVMRQGYMTAERGFMAVSGVSLTVYDSQENLFKVVIIPYTLEHTSFKYFKEGSAVDLELDVLGKYIACLCSFD